MELPRDPPETPPPNKPLPVNRRASPQNKLFQGVRKLKADWASNMPLSLGGRASNTVENKIENVTEDENGQREGMHKEEKGKGMGLSISSMNKEELLGMCMKLVKRQKLSEEAHSQLLETQKYVVEERAELLLLAKEVVGLPSSAPETDVISLRAAWLKNKDVTRFLKLRLANIKSLYVCCVIGVTFTNPLQLAKSEQLLAMPCSKGAVKSDDQNADNKRNEAEAINSQESSASPPSSLLQEEIETLKQELVLRNSSYSELEEEHKAVKEVLASTTSSHSELEEEIKTLKQELVSKTSSCSQLEEESKTSKQGLVPRASVSELEEEISMFNQELALQRSAYSELEEMYETLKHELSSTGSLSSQLEEENQKFKEELASIMSLYSELEGDIKTLKQELVSKTSSCSQLEEENKTFKQELASRMSLYSELEEDIKTLKQESSAGSSSSHLEEEIKTLKQELVSKTSFHSQLEEENKTLKHDLEQSRGMYMETISAAEANASKANEDIRKRLAIQEQYEEQISRLQQQVCNSDKKRGEAMEETKAAKDANESILAELKASRIAIAEAENKEILEARESVRAAQEETARLTALLDDEESKISDLGRMLGIKTDELAHSAALVQRLRTENQSTEQRHAERIAVLSSRLAEAKKSKESVQKMMEVEVENANERTQKLRESNKETDTRLKELMIRAEQAEAQAAALVSELEAVKQKAAQGASDTQQCTDLRAELEALRASGAAELASLTTEALKKSRTARTLLDEKDRQLEAAKEMMDDLRRELAQAMGSGHSGHAPLNIEYLRNVMIRYMSFGASSMERKRLLPVICTLLEFSEEDVKKLLKGLKWEWWGGTEMMKSIKNIKPVPTPTLERRRASRSSSDRPLLDPQNHFN